MQSATACATSVLVALLGLAGCQRSTESPADGGSNAAGIDQPPEPAAAAAPATEDETPAGVLNAYVFRCDDGSTLRVRNLFRERAVTVVQHEGERRLPQVPSGSGAKYSDGSLTFWSKGGEAIFERQGSPEITCTELRAESLLADARVRGLTFRGTGNEPGWLVEIGPNERLLFVTNFGEERHAFDPFTTRGPDESGVTVFEAGQDANAIKVTVVREACRDDMSGQDFDHRMLVEFAGRSLRGCATAIR